MKKFSKISGEKVGEQTIIEYKPTEKDLIKNNIIKLMDNCLSVQMYGPITRYHTAGTIKVAGKEMFLEALLSMLENISNNDSIKLLENLKSECNDWQLIDDKISELVKINERDSNSALLNHKMKINSLYNMYKGDKDGLIMQFEKSASKIKDPITAHLRAIAVEMSDLPADISSKVAQIYKNRSEALNDKEV